LVKHDFLGESSPSHEAARNIATVSATPEHFQDREARWKHVVKGHSRRGAPKRQGEANDMADIGGDGADALRRASTTFANVEPQPSTSITAASAPPSSTRPPWDILPHRHTIKQMAELFHVAT
jgi:hypothetical protein